MSPRNFHNIFFFQITDNCGEADEVCIVCRSNKGDMLKRFVDKTWGMLKVAAQGRLSLKSDCLKDITCEVNLN